jgi:transcriptional regulator with XRE-family HTH domain
MSAQAIPLSPNDDDRRVKLRTFLTTCRSRLRPVHVGLPSTSRRRVTGLRREEVAELVGVSSDWYRWFESGRPIRVSVPFLERLSRALRLKPVERLALFCLALPEIYEACVAHRLSVVRSSASPDEASPEAWARALQHC